jgi:hypothetical protein
MKACSKPQSLVFSSMVLLIIVSNNGCALTNNLTNGQLPNTDSASATETFSIQIQNNFGPPRLIKRNLKNPMTVQTALEEIGHLRKFRSMEINIHRRVVKTGAILKMPVEFQSGENNIKPEQDYAIHANDVIVLEPGKVDPLQKAVQTVLGPLAR